MGVLNVTPDSFADGGRFLNAARAVRRGLEMVANGADMIDVGGESTRPGSSPVSEAEELRRVMPVLEGLVSRTEVPISIDTQKPGVARRCVRAGTAILNDIRGFRDPEMIEVAADSGASVILMHMRGKPATMQRDTSYADVVPEVAAFLGRQAAIVRQAGITEIAVDPGIGFGKSARQNFEIVARLREIAALGFPVLVGPSRKSFLGSLPSRLPVEERLEGTLAAAAAAAMNGARIVRVHNVRPCKRVLEVVDAIKEAGRARKDSHP